MTRPLPEQEGTTDVQRPERSVLAGRYELQGVVGRGGMAEVHRAHDRALDRVVAVKLLPLEHRDDPDFAVRLRGEAKTAAALLHPNAVPVFDVGTEGDEVFVVMEYVEGRTLREELAERGRLPAAEVAEAGAAVCDALAAAHDRGIVHRDVNPGNVMRCSDGTVKLMDFGIARAGGVDGAGPGRTGTGVVIGTAAYLAPEQVRCETLDGRADLYALGCSLYELVTAELPFAGSSGVEVAARRLRESPTPPRARVPSLPSGLDAVILRALELYPTRRHPDARAMADDLRAAAQEAAGPASHERTTTRIRGVADPGPQGDTDAIVPGAGVSEPWSGVRRAGLALVTLAVLALVVVAVIVLVR